MRVMPRSLFGRLLATAAIALLAALAFAAFSIGQVLERFVLDGLDDRLDAQIAIVARAVRPDGSLDAGKAIDLPPFDQRGSGWSWEVRAPGGTVRSQSLAGRPVTVRIPRGPHPLGTRDVDARAPVPNLRPLPFEGRDPDGRAIHGRMLTVATARGNAEIFAGGPRAVVDRPLRFAMAPLLMSLLLLGAALALAILVQLRIGLRPVARLRQMIADVRAGTRDRVAATEPSELLPLVEELNSLIDTNRIALAKARGHVANLAHGLKTPLAVLRLDLDRQAQVGLVHHIDRIDAQIRHHLGRARAASQSSADHLTTRLTPHVTDLVAALARIHADRAVRANIDVPQTLAVRCDPQDLDEMLGNLLDNGWRWARTTVRIEAIRIGRKAVITIADDGPGIEEPQHGLAMEPGRRLDERGHGHGFGLSIARELAELHDGRLSLSNAPEGGLVATLRLPVPIG